MEYLDFSFLVLTETVKYFLVSYGIFGMKPKKDIIKYIPVLFVVILIMFAADVMKFDWFYLKVLYGFLIIALFFDEGLIKAIQFYFIQYIAINAIDILLWSVFAIFVQGEINDELHMVLNWISELTGCFIWCIICIPLKEIRLKINRGIKNYPIGYFILTVIFLSSICLVIGMAHGHVLGEMTDRIWKYFLTIVCAILVLFVILNIIFFYIVYSKKKLEKEKQFRDKYIVLQKMYYERMIEDDKKIRGFRHDIAIHIQVMNSLCRRNDLKALKKYIDNLSERYIEDAVVTKTGNNVADYFINQTISELRANGGIDYEIIGKFPQKAAISDIDFSILFGNAMENAKEALKEVEGDRKLKVSIMNYRGRIFLSISNSVDSIEDINLKTTKNDSKNHGYGIKNMIDVVKRYDGKIDFKIEEGMFVVEIEV